MWFGVDGTDRFKWVYKIRAVMIVGVQQLLLFGVVWRWEQMMGVSWARWHRDGCQDVLWGTFGVLNYWNIIILLMIAVWEGKGVKNDEMVVGDKRVGDV